MESDQTAQIAWDYAAKRHNLPQDRRPSFFDPPEALVAYIKFVDDDEAVAAFKEWMRDQATAYASDW